MPTHHLIEAFELVTHTEQLERRLGAAAAELAKRPGLAQEKAWLEIARQRVAAVRSDSGDLLTRVLRLPELEPLRGDYARTLQGVAVDALERLHAGIAFAGGARAPLLEALYYKIKVPALRRCDREDFERFCADFEKRLETSYAKRILAQPDQALVRTALAELLSTFAEWRSVFVAVTLGDAEAETLRAELEAAARHLEIPCRQARLLAQAALVPLADLLESSGLAQKPKKRGGRSEGDDDTHPLLEQDPPSPAEPTAEELAEIAAARAVEEQRAAL